MSSLDQDDQDEQDEQDNQNDQNEIEEQTEEETQDVESPPSGLKAWTAMASNYVVSKMNLLEQLGEGVGGYLLQPPFPPERTECSLETNDEEGTTSGGTSGDDIWGTPTSGGPDDESFTASPVRDSASYKIQQFSKVWADLRFQPSFFKSSSYLLKICFDSLENFFI